PLLPRERREPELAETPFAEDEEALRRGARGRGLRLRRSRLGRARWQRVQPLAERRRADALGGPAIAREPFSDEASPLGVVREVEVLHVRPAVHGQREPVGPHAAAAVRPNVRRGAFDRDPEDRARRRVSRDALEACRRLRAFERVIERGPAGAVEFLGLLYGA